MDFRGVASELEKVNGIYVFSRKSLKYILTAAVLVLAIFSIFAFLGIRKNGQSFRQYDLLLEKLNKMVDYGKSVPTLDNLRELEKDKVKLGEHFAELEKSLGKWKKSRITSPLEFKGELLRAQKSLLGRARDMGVKIPDNIGFDEFTGKKIPADSDIPKLAGQIDKVRALLNILMDSGAAAVHGVSRLEVTQNKADPKDRDYFYNEHRLEVRFESSQDALIRIMSALIGSREFFVVRDIEVKFISESKYSVKMVVAGIEFL